MSTTNRTASRRAAARLRALLIAGAALLLAATASAQSLTNLLPEDTFLAFGVSELGQHEAKISPFVDEWQRLRISERFTAAIDEDEFDIGEMDEALDEIPEELRNLTFFDLLGGELWVAAAGSPGGFMPGLVVVARVSASAGEALAAALERELTGQEMTRLSEGNIEFLVEESGDDLPWALALEGDFFAFASDPDVMRGVLRRYQGASEPNFTDAPGYAVAVEGVLPSNFVSYIDLPAAVAFAQPLAAGLGLGESVSRLADALRTAGTFVSGSRITDAGLEGFSVQALGDASFDPELHALLSRNVPVSDEPQRFAPGGTISYSASGFDAPGWWAYLDSFVNDLPELGIGRLSDFVMDNLGLDLSALLFDWMGGTFATISPYSPAAEIGVSPGSLLGDGVMLIEARDPAAATEGLTTLIQLGGMVASSFVDPFDEAEGGLPTPELRTVAGAEVHSYDLGGGILLEFAVTDGYVILAGSSAGMDAALNAAAAGGELPGELRALSGNVPLGASSVTLTDTAATLRMAGEQLTSQFGLLLGLAGGGIDFNEAEAAMEAMNAYFEFLAGKFGAQYGYGVADGDVLRGYSVTEVAW